MRSTVNTFLWFVRDRGEIDGIDETHFGTMTDAVVLDIDTALPVPPFPHVIRPPSPMQLFKRDRVYLDVPVMLKPHFVVAAEHRVHFELSLPLPAWYIGDNRPPVPWVVAVVNTQQDVRLRALLEIQKNIVENETVHWCVRRTSLLKVVPDVVVFSRRLHLPCHSVLAQSAVLWHLGDGRLNTPSKYSVTNAFLWRVGAHGFGGLAFHGVGAVENSECDPPRFLTDVSSFSGPDTMYQPKAWSVAALLLLPGPEPTLVWTFMSSFSVFSFGPGIKKRYLDYVDMWTLECEGFFSLQRHW
jgi:hypothetical protein